MSYSRVRSVPGALYGLRNNTTIFKPDTVFVYESPQNNAPGHPTSAMVQLHSADLVLCVASEVPNKSKSWSLVMYIDGTLDYPEARLGWVHNDQLQWIPDVRYS